MLPYFTVLNYNIPTYGLCIAIAIFLTVTLSMHSAKKKNVLPENIIIISASALGFCLIFGSLLYILITYSFSEIICRIKNLDFSFVFNSGIIFYGGLLGGILGAYIGARIAKIKLYSIESYTVPYIPLGHAIGRMGCLLAGCCYGFEYYGFGAIYYKHSLFSLPANEGHFPVQLLEAVLDLLIMLYLIKFCKKERKHYDCIFCYLTLYAIMRFFTEFFRGDEIRGAKLYFSTSQWISIAILAVCSIRFLISKLEKFK